MLENRNVKFYFMKIWMWASIFLLEHSVNAFLFLFFISLFSHYVIVGLPVACHRNHREPIKQRCSYFGNGCLIPILVLFQVFTSVALFNMLISPLNAFPWVLNGLVEAWVSVQRLQGFLVMDDLDLRNYYSETPAEESKHQGNAILEISYNWFIFIVRECRKQLMFRPV